MATPTERTALYRLYDANDRLLYLGITRNVKQRLGQHKATKFWWHLVVRTDTQWHPNRKAAEDHERAATLAERPMYDASYRAFNGIKYKSGTPQRDPFWRPLAERIYREIESGHYTPGQALPDATAMASKYGLSQTSVVSALRRLIDCHMVERPGPGNFYRYIVHLPDIRRPIEAIQEPTLGEAWEREQSE